MAAKAATPVWLWVPNVIGYVRIALLIAGFALCWPERPSDLFALLAVSALLDIADGVAARALDQRSSFGAFLDVAIDNTHRALVWAAVSPVCGAAVSSWEALVFACTHCIGSAWKADVSDAPFIVKHIMADNFKRPLGVWAMAGVWGLPHALFVKEHLSRIVPPGVDAGPGSSAAAVARAAVAACMVGRCLALTAEWFFFHRRIGALLAVDEGTSGGGVCHR